MGDLTGPAARTFQPDPHGRAGHNNAAIFVCIGRYVTLQKYRQFFTNSVPLPADPAFLTSPGRVR